MYHLQQYTFVATFFHIFWNTDAKEISIRKENAEITQLWNRVLIYIWLFFPFFDSTFGHFCLDFSSFGHFFSWLLSLSFLHRSDKELWRRALLLSLWRRANARNVSLFYSLWWLIYLINFVYNTKLPCYTLPPSQHHSYFRNSYP